MINVCESLSMSSARLSVGLKLEAGDQSAPLAWLSSSLDMLEGKLKITCMQKAVHGS